MNEQKSSVPRAELTFRLAVEGEWPPVGVEALPCSLVEAGYRIEDAPLFIIDLSVGDVISVKLDEDGYVSSWEHVEKSTRTTIWLLRIGDADNIDGVLKDLRALCCNTVRLSQHGRYAIDVPAECAIADVD